MNVRENTKNDLPQESADALIRSMRDTVREETGLEIEVHREMLPVREGPRLSVFVVTLPAGVSEALTGDEWGEMDYWLREVCGLIEYANPPKWYAEVAASR